ncbi:S-adenosyl-L-methionine-dependent methyltransferase [Xylaria acuta]|nr:S-adenosyl-L-methionine-dependent methyltransferase [Xylaria acuta]
MAAFSKSSVDFITAAQSVLAGHDEAARKQILDTATKAMAMLEAPLDTVWRMIMLPHVSAALMTLIKAGVIQEIAKSDSATAADHLASVSGAHKLLLVRLLRPLNALGFVNGTKQAEYAPTPITKTSVDCALLGDAHNTQDNMFPWLIKDPPMMGNMPHCLSIDIGGCEGVDIAQFGGRYRDAPGKLVLQDLLPVERQKYDFFQEQPFKSAKCYYFRSIFNDWPDADYARIWKNTAMDMTTGNTPLCPAILGVNMMAVLNRMERTEAQFSALLDAAGLKVVKLCMAPPNKVLD